jgi:hypothetical protein
MKMAHLKVIVPSANGQRERLYSGERWVGHLTKTRSGYHAHIKRTCSPVELTAVSALVASLNA